MKRRISTVQIILVLILALGLILRLWNIDFGLPYLLHPDEGFEVRRALQLGTGSFDFTRIGKGGYFYLLFLEYAIYFIVAYFSGIVLGAQEYGVLYLTEPSFFYLIGRITTALIGAATIFMVYKLASRIDSKEVGLIAALILALNPLHIEHSHFIAVDVPLTLFIVLSFYLFTFIDQNSTLRTYIVIGIAIACAATTKLPGMLLLLPYLLFQLTQAFRKDTGVIGILFDYKFVFGCVVFLVVFLIGTPGVIVHFDSFLEYFINSINVSDNSNAIITSNEVVGSDNNIQLHAGAKSGGHFLFYAHSIMFSMTPILVVFSIGGFFLAVMQKNVANTILAVFCLVFYAGLGVSSFDGLVYERYILPITTLLIVPAASAIGFVSNNLKSVISVSSFRMAIVITILVVLFPSYDVIARNVRFGLPDTRVVADHWFSSNVDEGSVVLLEGLTARPKVRTIPLRQSKEKLSAAIVEFEEREEPDKAYYFTLLRDKVDSKRYNLFYFEIENPPDQDYILENQIQYVVVNPNLQHLEKYKNTDFPSFLVVLNTSQKIEKVFSIKGDNISMTGPDIEIYRVH